MTDRGACYAFQKGTCNRGASCKFDHVTMDGEPPQRAPMRSASRGSCYAFERGDCEYGDDCKFSHGAGGAAPRSSGRVGNGGGGGGGFAAAPRTAGSNVCFAFQKGDCKFGSTCRYSHTDADVAAAPPRVEAASKPCFAYQKGDCKYGATCKFSHAIEA